MIERSAGISNDGLIATAESIITGEKPAVLEVALNNVWGIALGKGCINLRQY